MRLNFKDFKRFEKNNFKKYWYKWSKRIIDSMVLIVGVGGLGCPLLTYLAAAGVGTIGIVDHDKVEISNLNRQTLFVQSDIGKFKVIQAKTKIKKINNKINIVTYKSKLNEKNIKKILKNFQIICDGTDNYHTRYLINDECKRNKKILISAAISKFDGHLYKFNFKKKDHVLDVLCLKCLILKIIVKPKVFFHLLQEF